MSWYSELTNKLAHWLGRSKFDDSLDEELRSHMDMRADELVAAGGLSRQQAEAQTRREFGSPLDLAEQSRAAWRWGGLEDLGRDLCYAIRSLRRDRGFALTAILSLALGIGVNTTVFSMADGFLFSQPSGRNAESMVRARVGGRSMVGMREFRFLRDAGVFQDLVGFDENLHVNWRSGDASQRLFGVRVTGNFFEVTRVPVALGHPMQPGDRDVVIVSYRFWINHFQGDAGALGRVMVLDGLPHTLIGVLPPNHKTLIGLAFAPDVYLPVTSQTGSVGLYGRPPQGQSLSAFKEKLRAACERLDQVYPDADSKWITDIRVTYLTGIQRFTEGNKALVSFAAFFLMLMVIVGLLVIIACANVAGLLLARAAGRAREFAIRSSIGASRGRLIRQLLAESLLLSLLGAAAGLGLNLVLTRALSGIILPLPVPIVLEMAPDWKLLAYLALIAVVSAVTVGLLPALTSTRSLTSATPKG